MTTSIECGAAQKFIRNVDVSLRPGYKLPLLAYLSLQAVGATRQCYKIPQTRADISEFFERASGIVVPLLERVKKARELHRLSSRGEYDIVTTANLTELAKLLAAAWPLAAHRYHESNYDPCPTYVAAEEVFPMRQMLAYRTAEYGGYRAFTQIVSPLLRADGCHILRRPLPPTRLELH